jgi:hypothetical protein
LQQKNLVENEITIVGASCSKIIGRQSIGICGGKHGIGADGREFWNGGRLYSGVSSLFFFIISFKSHLNDSQFGNAYTTALVVLSLGAPNQLLPMFQRYK